MAEITVDYVRWKKGETGNHRFILYQSDKVARRDVTGKTVTFKFWSPGAAVNKGSGTLVFIDALNGEADYVIQATDVNAPGVYVGELIEDKGGIINKSNNLPVYVEDTAPA